VTAYLDQPRGQRVVTLGLVGLAHVVVVLFVLAQSGAMQALLPSAATVHLLPLDTPQPPPPPPIVPPPEPQPPAMTQVPVPDIVLAPPPPSGSFAARAIARAPGRTAPPASHFGAAGGDSGLGVGVATSATGGAGARGSLEDFEAAVKRAILARKVQPSLAWDRRNTCVVNYTAQVARNGALAGFQIDPCAIPEINQAARTAIQQAAPFPPPPDLGGRIYDVHGTLIFHP
jgi:protein TonB